MITHVYTLEEKTRAFLGDELREKLLQCRGEAAEKISFTPEEDTLIQRYVAEMVERLRKTFPESLRHSLLLHNRLNLCICNFLYRGK